MQAEQAPAHPTPGPQCVRCGVEMKAGFRADMAQGVLFQERWIPGPPEKSWWTKQVPLGQFKSALTVTSFRCPSCGYLESYAFDGGPVVE